MGLVSLTLRHFRLFTDVTVAPDQGAVTVFLSPNGTGKTSVLEAIHFLGTGRSFRTSTAGDVIANGQTTAEIHGLFDHDGRRITVDFTITRGERSVTKRMLINGQRPVNQAAAAEVVPLSIFTPDGVDMIRRGPETRRDFMSDHVVAIHPAVGDVADRYDRVVRQRNAILRSGRENGPTPFLRRELEPWTTQFLELAESYTQHRHRFITDLVDLAQDAYRGLTDSRDVLTLGYEQSWTGELSHALGEVDREEWARGTTVLGPHRDDFYVEINGRDARRQASQGEQRSAALALRLAAHHLHEQVRGQRPLLLLDDVFSELDPLRCDRLLTLLPVGQTLLTTASPLPSGMQPGSILDISGGGYVAP